jgi:hypothetical protein
LLQTPACPLHCPLCSLLQVALLLVIVAAVVAVPVPQDVRQGVIPVLQRTEVRDEAGQFSLRYHITLQYDLILSAKSHTKQSRTHPCRVLLRLYLVRTSGPGLPWHLLPSSYSSLYHSVALYCKIECILHVASLCVWNLVVDTIYYKIMKNTVNSFDGRPLNHIHTDLNHLANTRVLSMVKTGYSSQYIATSREVLPYKIICTFKTQVIRRNKSMFCGVTLFWILLEWRPFQ